MAAQTRAVVVAGLGGNADYELEFQRHANQVAKRLREVTDDVALLLGEHANRDSVQSTLADAVARSMRDDALVLVLVGHGSHDGERYKFNVPGKDFTAAELAEWLDPAPANRQLIVLTGSSSGAAQPVLERDGRTVITATRSGGERNATVFPRYFTSSLTDDAADINKDQRVTAQEAFDYAVDRVENHYTGAREMSTEHPTTSGPESAIVLALLEVPTSFDPALSEAVVERNALEESIAALRADRDSYTTDEYFAELQRLLLELAVIERRLEAEAESAEGLPP